MAGLEAARLLLGKARQDECVFDLRWLRASAEARLEVGEKPGYG